MNNIRKKSTTIIITANSKRSLCRVRLYTTANKIRLVERHSCSMLALNNLAEQSYRILNIVAQIKQKYVEYNKNILVSIIKTNTRTNSSLEMHYTTKKIIIKVLRTIAKNPARMSLISKPL